ncbi:MAG TPA: NAAT family transporter [Elusimicrobiota bacterium]|nr:NAAT family transporter [Elusimicrobiota bacterium]
MLEYALLTFGSLFAIVDPFAAIPAFLAMTPQDSAAQRKKIARTACLVCWLVLTAFAAGGPLIFRMLGITLKAFQIAGGLVLLLSSLDMLRAQPSPLRETAEETEAAMSKDDIAITPLAIPMLSGPGSITTAIVLIGHAHSFPRAAIFYGVIALVSLLSYLILTLAVSGAKRLSPIALNIINRLMGLMLVAIGVQFIISALNI